MTAPAVYFAKHYSGRPSNAEGLLVSFKRSVDGTAIATVGRAKHALICGRVSLLIWAPKEGDRQ